MRSTLAVRFAPCALTVLFGLLLFGCGGQEDANRLAELTHIGPGSAVADFGAGKGELTIPMAERVGASGHVYASEIDPARLSAIRERAASAGVQNVTVVEGGEKSTNLPDNCCDVIFMRGVYHHLTDPADIDRSLYRAVRPGGEIAIQDFRPTIWLAPWTPKGIPANRGGHGVTPEIVTDEMTAAGFKLERTIDPWTSSWFFSNYCLVFRKPAATAATR
jgi:ubiquinone/menaquinone biosynthesis C-methylase UbiE